MYLGSLAGVSMVGQIDFCLDTDQGAREQGMADKKNKMHLLF
jgi:hypothetical protein